MNDMTVNIEDASQDKFAAVLNGELALIAEQRLEDAKPSSAGSSRDGNSSYQTARAMNLAALAFSGGGIRSASFNLGFLQGLANRKALPLFDYLSTVSGGGYVGGWLSALLYRKNGGAPVGEAEVSKLQDEFLATPPDGCRVGENSGFPLPESQPIRFLRRYAEYLNPRLGLSGDTVALVALMVRNAAVMQMLLVSMLVAVFSLLLLLAGGEWASSRSVFATADGAMNPFFTVFGVDYSAPGRWLVLPAMFLLFLALLAALFSQASRRGRPKGEAEPLATRYISQSKRNFLKNHPNRIIALDVLFPALLSGVFLAIALDQAANSSIPPASGIWIAAPLFAYGLAWLSTLKSWRAWIGMLGGAATLGFALYLGVGPLSGLLRDAPFGHAIAFAPPVAMALQSLVITVHLALAGSAISEQNREWWARAGGLGMSIALAWTLAFCFLLYAPPLIHYGMEWSLAGGGLWAALTWFGTRLAQGTGTGNKNGVAWKEMLAKIAPWIFLAGLLGLVSWTFVNTLPWVKFDGCCTLSVVVDSYHASLHASLKNINPLILCAIFVVAGLLFLFLLRLVDLNLFSAHSFYRNRLARTFMGASRDKRSPNPFTGFDPEDDVALAELACQRPIHLINANLNMTGGDELAWQTRRGASFVFTPCHSGYSTCTSLGEPIGAYRPTSEYGGGLSLATVVAVSGAAASPNMGFHTSTSVAALLTAFNLRLARWCPNPARDQWRNESPKWSSAPLFAELFGEANGKNAWLNLSDGGQFDNLGLYELVRRRAALILVTDVGADGKYQFDDLAMVVRKLSVDFGVDLEIDEAALNLIRPACARPGAGPGASSCFSEKHWAFGRIRYPDADPGYLIYVKSSLSAEAPVDIRQYRDAHTAFPHESTADQWFDEDQFEAYRHLGQSIAEKLLDELASDNEEATNLRVEALCKSVESMLSAVEKER